MAADFPWSDHLAMKLLQILLSKKDICFCNLASQQSSMLCSKIGVSYH